MDKENRVEMLWEKETIKGERVFAKLRSKNEQKSFSEAFVEKVIECTLKKCIAKNNSLALKSRQQGNELFRNGLYKEAIGVFNQTLPYVENGTEDLGICYANRSACFFKMKQYKLCLADIALAKKNKYPARLMPKLENRKIECEKLLAADGDDSAKQLEPTLSFDADEKMPCFAKGLDVKFSENYGNHIVTNRALEIGQTVIVERAFVFKATDTFYLHCENCFSRTTNLILCENCVNAVFCSQKCCRAANEKYHDVLCDLLFLCNGEPMQVLLLQSIVVAVRTFSTLAALMAAIEEYRNSQDGIDFDDPAKRAYFQFFNLRTNMDKMSAHERNEMMGKAMQVVEMIRTHSRMEPMFRTRKLAQFLSHLALHRHQGMHTRNVVWHRHRGVQQPDKTFMCSECLPNIFERSGHLQSPPSNQKRRTNLHFVPVNGIFHFRLQSKFVFLEHSVFIAGNQSN